jgi:hypothetical protein
MPNARRMQTVTKILGLAAVFGLTGCSSQTNLLIDPSTLPAVVAPNATALQYTDLGNTPLNVAAAQGLLVNNAGSYVNVSATTSADGTVVGHPDGSFIYTPAAGFVGNDTFAYDLTNALGSSSSTVTISISQLAIYVDNTATGTPDGSLAAPYSTLSAAVTAAAGSSTAFVVKAGDGTGTGLSTAVSLSAGQS